MTLHVCVRPIPSLLLLAVILLRLLTPAAAQPQYSLATGGGTTMRFCQVGVELSPDIVTLQATSALRASVPKP